MTAEHRQPPDLTEATFVKNSNLGDAVNHAILQSEIEGGVYLRDLPRATAIEIETENHSYTAVIQQKGEALIWGHPELCSEPVLVGIHGSTWGGSMMKLAFIGRGMHLEFQHPSHPRPIVTSRIVEIRQVALHQVSAEHLRMCGDTGIPDQESHSEK